MKNVISFFFVVLSVASLFHGSRGESMPLRLFTEQEAAQYNARCLDGSPYGYYYAPALTPQSSNKWVFWLSSGGFCRESCPRRANTADGSSKYFASSVSASFQLLTRNSTNNPTFWDWNLVMLPYCTGDLHVGQVANPSPASYGLYMTGRYNVLAVLADLKANHGLNAASDVVVSGTSAGGYGVLLNIDTFAEAVPTAKTSGIPQAGLFFWPLTFDTWETLAQQQQVKHGKKSMRGHKVAAALSCEEDINHNPVITETIPQLVSFWNAALHPACVAATPSDSAYRCINANYLLDFIKSPLLVVNALYDSDQLFLHLDAPKYTNPPSKALTDYMDYYAGCTNSVKDKILAKPNKSSVFLPACLSHVFGVHGPDAVLINGKSVSDVVDDWYNGRTPSYAVDSCAALGCNPSCPAPSYTDDLASEWYHSDGANFALSSPREDAVEAPKKAAKKSKRTAAVLSAQ